MVVSAQKERQSHAWTKTMYEVYIIVELCYISFLLPIKQLICTGEESPAVSVCNAVFVPDTGPALCSCVFAQSVHVCYMDLEKAYKLIASFVGCYCYRLFKLCIFGIRV